MTSGFSQGVVKVPYGEKAQVAFSSGGDDWDDEWLEPAQDRIGRELSRRVVVGVRRAALADPVVSEFASLVRAEL
ncbi:hypothetical protein F4561_005272 [Lipingzhangella halophila]|uniref:Uncharacterized protein n=1 Tax=Lipingzhangella halophila TaxID=1783352 RepID=A0A7W7W4R8_9ACTN|nr:hypothetical protein [Lipingzhangella halophila]MBB4934452.1 hypothetical protein [Lipingzhangella halophila]